MSGNPLLFVLGLRELVFSLIYVFLSVYQVRFYIFIWRQWSDMHLYFTTQP